MLGNVAFIDFSRIDRELKELIFFKLVSVSCGEVKRGGRNGKVAGMGRWPEWWDETLIDAPSTWQAMLWGLTARR